MPFNVIQRDVTIGSGGQRLVLDCSSLAGTTISKVSLFSDLRTVLRIVVRRPIHPYDSPRVMQLIPPERRFFRLSQRPCHPSWAPPADTSRAALPEGRHRR
eukprot:scaffold770_cov255-Pinguiococcus_pyrenoidosus.AAC.29